MSTITDVSPVIRLSNPSPSEGSGSDANTSGDSTETTQNTQTTGGAGSATQTSGSGTSSGTEQAQTSTETSATERSSQTVGSKPANADAESVVLSNSTQVVDLSDDALAAAESEARRQAEASLDRLRLEQLITGLSEARTAFENDLQAKDSAAAEQSDPVVDTSAAAQAEAIRLGGSTY